MDGVAQIGSFIQHREGQLFVVVPKLVLEYCQLVLGHLNQAMFLPVFFLFGGEPLLPG